ncbi:MAG: DUF2628 domain-containing protein [Methylobacteriaceae bacterium]|nr:DUF2628 domain-containing protein [Methylobacteriaceae bacterium]
MTATYTLHAPPDLARGDPDGFDRVRLVRDGFSFWAFAMPSLWFFAHRHWLAGLAALVLVAALPPIFLALGASPGSVVAAELLVHLLFGLEASSIRRFTYERRGMPAEAVVSGADEAEAERKAAALWLGDGEERAAPPIPAFGVAAARPTPWSRSGEPEVLGLFPRREGRP